MAHYDFYSDLAVAEKTESEIGRYLESNYKIKVLEYNNDKRYDLLVRNHRSEVPFRIEIKEDFMSHSTGNIAIEFESRGKASGISVTESEIYIYKVVYPDGQYDLISAMVDDIKKAIAERKYFRVVSGGDKGSNTKMYLFKRNVFSEFSQLI
jgi:hypothetical protein